MEDQKLFQIGEVAKMFHVSMERCGIMSAVGF